MSLCDNGMESLPFDPLKFLPCDESDLATLVAPALVLLKKAQEEHPLDLSLIKNLLVEETKKELPDYTKLHLNGELVGWYHLIDHDDYLELDDVNVLENFRNLGLGTNILNRLKIKAQELEVPIHCHVLKNNPRAINFYNKAEFKPIKEDEKVQILQWQSRNK